MTKIAAIALLGVLVAFGGIALYATLDWIKR